VILIRRAAALTLVLIVSALPLALERCRAACVQASTSQVAAASTHACHQPADADDGPVLTASPRACGHSDDARTADLNAIGSGPRLDDLIAPSPIAVSISLGRAAGEPIPARPPDLSSVETSRNLPLRL
jgi:hypothetical protein